MARGGAGAIKTSEKQLDAVERQRQALELRKQGKGFVAIAQELGYAGPSSAYKAVETALRKTLQEPADELRKLEAERLDVALTALWPNVEAGKGWAIDRMLSIMDRRARLFGLDMPTRIEQTGTTTISYASELDPDTAAAIEEAERIITERRRETSL